MQVFVTTREGTVLTISGRPDSSLMQTIRDGGGDELLGLCGGCCSCATCHVYVDSAFWGVIGGPGRYEGDLLETSSHKTANSRLSCQIILSDEVDGLRVEIAPAD